MKVKWNKKNCFSHHMTWCDLFSMEFYFDIKWSKDLDEILKLFFQNFVMIWGWQAAEALKFRIFEEKSIVELLKLKNSFENWRIIDWNGFNLCTITNAYRIFEIRWQNAGISSKTLNNWTIVMKTDPPPHKYSANQKNLLPFSSF